MELMARFALFPNDFFVSPPTLPKPPAKLVLAEREVSEVDRSSALPCQPQFSNAPFSSNSVLVHSLANQSAEASVVSEADALDAVTINSRG